MKGTAYLLQATLVLLWWLGLLTNQKFFLAFQFPEISSTAFYSFLLPDIAVIALLSIVRAYRPIRALELIILGGFAFGTLYCINASFLTHGGYLATTIMTLGLFYNLFLAFQERAFRASESKSFRINILKTLVQIICVWGITLILFPLLILTAFGENLSPQFGVPTILGIVLFVGFSILGLSSAIALVKGGDGTPLPIDQTNKLVLSGPYKYVRNPMAIAGVGQGIAVSLVYLSLPIFIYAILGGVLWHIAVRPLEEKNMRERFGREYDEYQKRLRCWIPRARSNTK